jgi:hypothetical protein
MPMLRAPRTANPEFQRTIDDITDKVNILVARENAVHALETRQDIQGYVHVQGQGLSLLNTRNGNRQSQQGFVHAYTPANFVLPAGDICDEQDHRNKENREEKRSLPYPGGDRVPMSGGLFAKRNGVETDKEPAKAKERKSRRKLFSIKYIAPLADFFIL